MSEIKNLQSELDKVRKENKRLMECASNWIAHNVVCSRGCCRRCGVCRPAMDEMIKVVNEYSNFGEDQ